MQVLVVHEQQVLAFLEEGRGLELLVDDGLGLDRRDRDGLLGVENLGAAAGRLLDEAGGLQLGRHTVHRQVGSSRAVRRIAEHRLLDDGAGRSFVEPRPVEDARLIDLG